MYMHINTKVLLTKVFVIDFVFGEATLYVLIFRSCNNLSLALDKFEKILFNNETQLSIYLSGYDWFLISLKMKFLS